jgi:hypothetical protein
VTADGVTGYVVELPNGTRLEVPASQVGVEYRVVLSDGRCAHPGPLLTAFGQDVSIEAFLEGARRIDPEALLESRQVFTFPTEWSPA